MVVVFLGVSFLWMSSRMRRMISRGKFGSVLFCDVLDFDAAAYAASKNEAIQFR